MMKEICETCGCISRLGAIVRYPLIPESVTEQAGMPESTTVNLCSSCHAELYNWYKMKVSNTVFDPMTKRFRDTTWEEKVRDYESTFDGFKKYKNEQKNKRYQGGRQL